MSNDEHIKQLLVQVRPGIRNEALKERLVAHLNELLVNNFTKLVQILYQADVDEKKLKSMLEENHSTDAALVIADLLIQREEEKQRMRAHFKPSDNSSDEEKW